MTGRVVDVASARARWGSRADRVASAYHVGDPIADEAVAAMGEHVDAGYRELARALEGGAVHGPRALQRLVDEAHASRSWFDPDRSDRGAAVLRRWAPWTALVLRCDALPRAYASPIGNKPLAMTGRLADDTRKRLTYTARFVWGTQQPGAMARRGPGVRACTMVRWTHAVVRAGLRRRGWNPGWGAPLPQPDLAATALLFGVVAVDGLRRLGADIDDDEADAVAHLYRAVGDRVGVPSFLQTDAYAEGRAQFELLTAMHGRPDADSVRLTEALMSTPLSDDRSLGTRGLGHALRWALRGVAGGLLGELGAQLGLPAGRRRCAAASWLLRMSPSPLPGQPLIVDRLLR